MLTCTEWCATTVNKSWCFGGCGCRSCCWRFGSWSGGCCCQCFNCCEFLGGRWLKKIYVMLVFNSSFRDRLRSQCNFPLHACNAAFTRLSDVLASSKSVTPVLKSMFEFSLTKCAYKSNATLSIICVVDSSLSLAAVVTSLDPALCDTNSVTLGLTVGFSFVFTSFAFANSFSKTRDPFDCPFSPRLNDWLSTNSKLGRLMLIFFVVSSTLLRTWTVGVTALRGGNRVFTGNRSSLVSSITGIDWRPLPRDVGNSFRSKFGFGVVLILSYRFLPPFWLSIDLSSETVADFLPLLLLLSLSSSS